jgi:hypothetical protein
MSVAEPKQFAGDYRRSSPRFLRENINRNIELVERIEKFASEKKCTAAQLALAPGSWRRELMSFRLRAPSVAPT